MIEFTSGPVEVTGTKVKPPRAEGENEFRSFWGVPAGSGIGRKDAVEFYLPQTAELPSEGDVVVIVVHAEVDHEAVVPRNGAPFSARRTKFRVKSLAPVSENGRRAAAA